MTPGTKQIRYAATHPDNAHRVTVEEFEKWLKKLRSPKRDKWETEPDSEEGWN